MKIENKENKTVINVGLVGYGLSGRFFQGGVLRGLKEFDIKMIVTTNPEKKVQAKLDFPRAEIVDNIDEITKNDNIDLVIISTPNQLHFELANKALDAGKHVVIEKPFTPDSLSAKALIEKADKLKLVLSAYQNRRYDGDYLTLKSLIANGSLGRLVELESHFDRFRPEVKKDGWRECSLPGSGVLFDLGSHLIDQALDLFGMPDELYCDIARQRQSSEVDQFEMILYYEEKNLKVTLKAGSLVNVVLPRFMALGTKGSYATYGLDPQENALRCGESYPIPAVDEKSYGILYEEDNKKVIPTLTGDYRLYYKGIYEAIVNKTIPPVTALEAYQVIRLIELGHMSDAEKRRISVKDNI